MLANGVPGRPLRVASASPSRPVPEAMVALNVPVVHFDRDLVLIDPWRAAPAARAGTPFLLSPYYTAPH